MVEGCTISQDANEEQLFCLSHDVLYKEVGIGIQQCTAFFIQAVICNCAIRLENPGCSDEDITESTCTCHYQNMHKLTNSLEGNCTCNHENITDSALKSA